MVVASERLLDAIIKSPEFRRDLLQRVFGSLYFILTMDPIITFEINFI